MKTKVVIPMVLVMAGVALGPIAQAATINENFQINLNVLQGGSCTISSGQVNTTYDPGSPNPTTAVGINNVTCTSGTPWTLEFDQGEHADAGSSCTNPVRRVATGTSYVNYGLYADSAGTLVIGCDPATDLQGSGTGSAEVAYVYFRAPAGQTPAASGAHTDTVVMTLSF